MAASLDTAKPRQDRSARTLEAILSATERLLQERAFEAIGVAEIVAEAGVSTGSFYARMASKEALLPLLYRRYHEQVSERAAHLIAEVADAPDLAAACRIVVDWFAWISASQPNLMRAVSWLARTDPAAIAHLAAERTSSIDAIEQAMACFSGEISRAPTDQSIRVAIFMAATVLREAVLFPGAPLARATLRDVPDLRPAVVAMMVGFLGQETGE